MKKRIRNGFERFYWELGQTTAEYALVMLAAAAIVGILITWASKQDNGLSKFFDAIVGKLTESLTDGGGGGGGGGGGTGGPAAAGG